MSSSRFVARLATVQALCSLTNQVHELHRLDGIGVSHHVSCSTQFTSLYTTSHTRMKLNGRLFGIISLLALGLART